MALALQEQREFNGQEIVIERPDGSRVTVLAHANPIHDDSGRLVGAVNVLVDITQRKRDEIALAESHKHKDEFLATLAHELRNPLAPIRNAVHFLKLKGSLEPDVQMARDLIDRQVENLVRLVDDLLDVSRINSNRLELRKERVNLRNVIDTAVETSRPLIEAQGHQLDVTLPPSPISVHADSVRLSQAIANLLNNAAKYTEPGGRICLKAERQGSDAVVSVRDNGIGIPAKMLPHIFEMFTQSQRSLNRSQGGLGIGLALVRRLVEMHGGSVEAKSAGPDTGSEFILRFPVMLEADNAQVNLRPDSELAGGALRILVVDDNPDVATSLAMMLKMVGNEVRIANDGLEGLRAADEFRPAVVLLDIGLPKINGYEAARQIRQHEWGKQMVLIALTGWGQDEDRRHSTEAGFNHHLVKPIKLAPLLKLLARAAEPTAFMA
jgi:signal transduction histidine kinase/ActR/RegA family two-component response regulator